MPHSFGNTPMPRTAEQSPNYTPLKQEPKPAAVNLTRKKAADLLIEQMKKLRERSDDAMIGAVAEDICKITSAMTDCAREIRALTSPGETW